MNRQLRKQHKEIDGVPRIRGDEPNLGRRIEIITARKWLIGAIVWELGNSIFYRYDPFVLDEIVVGIDDPVIPYGYSRE